MTSERTSPAPGLVVQKDGSLALSLEFAGGLVSPEVLEAAAAVARRHGALLHLTTAQKLMVLGLDDRSGPAAMEALEAAGAVVRKARDISQARVCVGKPYCPLALQETLPAARLLYERAARHPIPPKMKVGIAGCPACCSWANVMDLGFVGLRSGFKVMLGGHGGYRPRPGVDIGRVPDAEAAAAVLLRLADLFARETEKKGRVDKIVEKLGVETLQRELGL
ncbi:hypothetical protein G3N55_10430 [Dissulfurirhabdus thermomarina]|uniref:Nitrite reductase n=1 Tax=Dissulfurirhabdus thermomarina TaxID=1765737 RepID=A0A6N9TPQ6_DISTH|nr:hypothetical protein [Dissulfurirhabdus thermomarina]NDY43255.1 hypothetical protein [Dissulfurirhabdus thermomarina]NMX23126.1 hypothetical protein [Dissulfurirhabdus thermomarina]